MDHSAERRMVRLRDGAASSINWRPAPGAPTLKTPIHFAHANGFNAQTYTQMLRPLARDRIVMASDFRGHGQSTLSAIPDHLAGWRVYAEDLAAVLDQTPGGPFVLGGHSMGATTSLWVAATRPDLVRALVLVEPVILPRGARFFQMLAQRLGLADRDMPLAKKAARRRPHWPDVDTAMRSYRGRGAFHGWPDQMLRDYLEGGTRPDPKGGLVLSCAPQWEAANYVLGPPDLWGLLAGIRVPVTLLSGGKGSTCSPQVARSLEKRIKQLKWLYFAECSHFLPMERPESVAEELQSIAE